MRHWADASDFIAIRDTTVDRFIKPVCLGLVGNKLVLVILVVGEGLKMSNFKQVFIYSLLVVVVVVRGTGDKPYNAISSDIFVLLSEMVYENRA